MCMSANRKIKALLRIRPYLDIRKANICARHISCLALIMIWMEL